MLSNRPPADDDVQPFESSPYATLVLNLGRALMHAGSPSHRLETAMQVMADRLGLTAEFFSTPTALMISLGDGSRQQVYLARVEPGDPNLAKLSELTAIMEQLASGELDPIEADRQVREIDARPPAYRGATLLAAFMAVSAGACTLIGGGLREMLTAGVLGGLTGLCVLVLGRGPDLSRLVAPVAAFIVTLVGTLWCGYDGQTALMPAVIAGIIALIPGMDLTISTRELATGHLVAGSSRMLATIMVFAFLSFGLAAGGAAGQALIGPVDLVDPSPLPPGLLYVGFAMAAIGFVALFQALLRDWIWILLACMISVGAAGLGGLTGSPVMGAFLGGLFVAMSGNLFARITGRPGSVMLLPGLILLVPGSIGMRSLAAIVGQDILSGLETAFLAGMIAVALTAGMILASVLVPPRISL
jgi:uncharacterized membrane protein YjjP (DUF1212 family)